MLDVKLLLIGLFFFMTGIYISNWTLFGIPLGIGGGMIMGISSLQDAFKKGE